MSKVHLPRANLPDRHAKIVVFVVFIVLAMLSIVPRTFAQTSIGPSQPLITQSVQSSALTVLAGNTRPEAKNLANDLGLVPDSMPLPHLRVLLRRPAIQEQALELLIDRLHDPNSPNYHHWLSAAELGAQFGPASSDIQTVTGWLAQQGFAVNTVSPSGLLIDFSATAGQVRAIFRTEIHYLNVNGNVRFANMSDPAIPAALAPAVVGILTLNNIPPRTMLEPKTEFSAGGGKYPVVPADLATIYNFNPVFSGGNVGQAQTIYLIETSNLFSNGDWTTFRNTFGLSSYPSTLSTIHPGNCADPGVTGAEGEAIVDAEWASAAAPGAAIVMVSCTSILTAVQNLVEGATSPGIMSISYGSCEAALGAAENAAFNSAYQTGVAGGASIFVSTGDSDADVCDRNDLGETDFAEHGISVSGYASTSYNVAVGGTDFSDTYNHVNSSYWSAVNGPTYGSALSYVPEIPWNNSCASVLLANFAGYTATYGASGYCATGDHITIVGGSGGPSGCATGAPSMPYVVGGTCAGYPKPAWQGGLLGNPSDGVRDTPDVSLFAASGLWNHYYILCNSDAAHGGVGCNGDPSTWNTAGGTSFASPIWAGIQALVNQSTGERQGNPNYRLYVLAGQEYRASGSVSCNASNGNTIAGSCIFHDVTLGDNDADCENGSANCYDPSGPYGVLSASTSAYLPTYKAQTGWDFATGIGTVNVANLVAYWAGVQALVATHDFNGDGRSDVLWRDSSGNVGMWLMNGQTIAKANVLGSVSSAWSVVGQRSFTGNADADVLWRDTSGNVGMWLMNGTQIQSTSVLGNVGANWSVVGTGDFNGDGMADVLWRDTSGNVGIWLMNGTAIQQTAVVGNMPIAWIVAGADMKGDIFWRNTSTGDVEMWVMNGTTIAQSVDFGSVPLTWSIAGIGDFDGNGSEDILWRDTSGNVGIWLMNGTQIMSTAVLGNVPLLWTIAQTGDYNGDGKSDILWTDSSGDVGAWFMNGASISSYTVFGNVGLSWAVQSLNAD